MCFGQIVDSAKPHYNKHCVVTFCNYTLVMKFDRDEEKRLSNIAKHGFDFIGVETVFAGKTATVLDNRFEYREKRFVTFGLFYGRVVAVTHLETDETIRVIGVRNATSNEEENYFKQIAD